MEKRLDLTGKQVLITGASRGIGRALALGFAQAGADVAVHFSGNSLQAQEVAELIRGLGRRALCVQQDLIAPDCAQRIWQQMEASGFGPVDVLVLNASQQIQKPWEQITLEDFETQISVNTRASLLLMQKAVPAMRGKGWGRILTVGSVQEHKPHPEMLVYSASKAAQTMMVRSLAAQLAPEGITVNNLAPGVIMTDRNAQAYADEAYRQKVTESIPCGFWGEPEDCVGSALLLCSEAGRYITGQSLLVDGGKAL